MSDDVAPVRAKPPRSGCSWVFVVIPAFVVATIVIIVGAAARSGQDDDRPGARIPGPAAELPAVSEALTTLVGEVPTIDRRAATLGERAGVIAVGLVEIDDEVEFAAQFDRLPDPEAEALGEALGAVQRELSPEQLGGPRRGGDRVDDMAFALAVIWAAAPVLDPAATPETQALNVLPASVPLADDGDGIVAAVIAGDMATAAELLDPVLSEAGAAELISGLAGDISDRVGDEDRDRLAAFQEAYNLELP
ncbi:MAG: hypothetical protein ACK5OX_00275 [Desertimonas sp.]